MIEKSIHEKNKMVYPNKTYYIDKPELYLLYKYENIINNAKMLDIGIGFGRTTHYFAEVTKEYVGIDYQKDPVDFCKKKYIHLQNAEFYICDARNMRIFEDNYFDIILFSFNGIDYVSHHDRLEILKEMKRICKQDGIVYFSTHNLQSIENLFSFKFSYDPLKCIYSFRKKLLLKRKNPKITNLINNISNIEYAIICDGGQNFKLDNYYIAPDKQIDQLVELGFKDIKVISLSDGIEVKNKSELKTIKDPWIYYLCRA